MDRRSEFDIDTRVTLLEDDVGEFGERYDRLSALIYRLIWMVAGAALTFAVSAVLFAGNLIALR